MPFKRPDSKYWIASARIGGKQVRRSTRTTDYAEAVAYENKWRTSLEIEEGSWEHVMQTYLKAKGTERAGYAVKAMQSHFKGQELTRQVVLDYVENRRLEGIRDGTIRRELGVVRAAYSHVRVVLGWDIRNFPVEALPPKPKSRIRWLTRREYDDLVSSARSSKAPYLAPFIQLATNTGLRKGEIMNLTWDRVHDGMIHLDPEHQKNKSQSTVPLNSKACQALEILWCLGDGKYVMPVADVKKAFNTAVRKAGLEDVTIHTLRHTCASWLVKKGVPIRTVAEVLRHKDISTTMVYAHLSPEDAKKAVELL